MLRIFEQVVQSVLDQRPILPSLRRSPASAAVLQRITDVSASRRRDDEACHLRGIIRFDSAQISRNIRASRQYIAVVFVDVANASVNDLS